MEPLTEQQAAILAFERKWWRYAGAKESCGYVAAGFHGYAVP